MKNSFSCGVFSTVFIAVYLVAYWFKLPLATYLPVENAWHLGRAAGQFPMLWYGLVVTALLPATAAGFLIPEPRSRAWAPVPMVLACLSILVIVVHELHWFKP